MSSFLPHFCSHCKKPLFVGAHEYCMPLPNYAQRSERVMARIRPRKTEQKEKKP